MANCFSSKLIRKDKLENKIYAEGRLDEIIERKIYKS